MGKKIMLTEVDEIVIRKKLIDVASEGETICYGALRLEKDSLQMSHLKKVIEKISLYELEHKRPILCAIVVRKGKKAIPGVGFQKFCEKYDIDSDFEHLKQDCFDRWGDDDFRNANKEL